MVLLQRPDAWQAAQARHPIPLVLHLVFLAVLRGTDVQGEECGGASHLGGEVEGVESGQEVGAVVEVGL